MSTESVVLSMDDDKKAEGEGLAAAAGGGGGETIMGATMGVVEVCVTGADIEISGVQAAEDDVLDA